MNSDGRQALASLIDWHRETYKTLAPSRPFFPSRNKNRVVAINRQTAYEMLKKAFQAAGLNGKLATHSLRKSFAQRVYAESGDIYLVSELLGHRNVSTTFPAQDCQCFHFNDSLRFGENREETSLLQQIACTCAHLQVCKCETVQM